MVLFNDLKKHYASCRRDIDAAVRAVFDSGSHILGREVQEFEREFAAYCGVAYCVGVASGTEAIALALMALDIGAGHEVITTNMTAFPTVAGIRQAGAIPVVADIRSSDGLLDPASVERNITAGTRAIVAVHLYGQCCDMDPLLDLARQRNLYLIEDAAQAAGSTYNGRNAGSMGVCTAFSFYPTKNLGAFGDAGAVTTNSSELYQKLLMLRNYGQSRRYYHDAPGINSRLDELQAAMLRAKLPHLDEWNKRRAAIAARYRQGLKNVTCLDQHAYGTSNNHLFVVRHERRDHLMEFLRDRGIQTLIHYPVPINRQKAFRGKNTAPLPESETFADTIVSLPLYPELEDNEVDQVIEAINDCR
ncbi:MAG: DegT/DnrJ/EryC1/StrS family aminotransferase [Chitinispirillaceae bacterium]|nr:DegT/DnrJ/EryC1/StrS family aminotransferase [Chitinispirillaceae bacterium]